MTTRTTDVAIKAHYVTQFNQSLDPSPQSCFSIDPASSRSSFPRLTPFGLIYKPEKHSCTHVHAYLVGPHSLVADLSINRTFDDSRHQFGNVLFVLFLTLSLFHCKEK